MYQFYTLISKFTKKNCTNILTFLNTVLLFAATLNPFQLRAQKGSELEVVGPNDKNKNKTVMFSSLRNFSERSKKERIFLN